MDDFFRFSNNKIFRYSWSLVLGTVVSVLVSASVGRCFVSRMQDFCYIKAVHIWEKGVGLKSELLLNCYTFLKTITNGPTVMAYSKP